MVWGPRASTLLVLLAPSVFWENRAFCINSEDFPESWISAQKRDTRAILLKTTLVRVSCIQNTQIRGKTIAKVFGKVDTFWTYHRADLLCGALVSPLNLPFRLLKAFVAKTPVPRATIRKTFQRRRRRQSHLGGFRRSPPTPCQRGDSSPGGLFIAMIASGVMSE